MRKRWVMLFVLAFFAVIIFATPLRSGIYAYITAGKAVVTIENFEVKTSGSAGSCAQKYLVFTDKGVFENTDSGWRFKWNSSDLHGDLVKLKGQKIVLYYYGWRIPYRSWYPNIYKFEKVSEP